MSPYLYFLVPLRIQGNESGHFISLKDTKQKEGQWGLWSLSPCELTSGSRHLKVAFGQRASVLIPCPSPKVNIDLRSLSRGGAKLWFRRTSQTKRMFLDIARSHLVLTPLEPQHISLPVSKKQSVACFALLPTTLAHSQPAPPSPQHPGIFTQPAPRRLLAALRQQSRGLWAACRLTPGQAICSDVRRLASESQGARCCRLTGSSAARQQQPPGTAQPGPQGCLAGGRMGTGKGAGRGKKRKCRLLPRFLPLLLSHSQTSLWPAGSAHLSPSSAPRNSLLYPRPCLVLARFSRLSDPTWAASKAHTLLPAA